MMKRNVILMIIGTVVIIGSCDGANIRRIFRSKRSESDFILRSCTASAQLIRKYRTNTPTDLAAESSSISKVASESLVLDNANPKKLWTRLKSRHLSEKSITDSPLGTVDVKAIHKDVPKAFKKKDPLPELDRNSSARNLDTDAPIIVVQPFHH